MATAYDDQGGEYIPDEAAAATINLAREIQGRMLFLITDMSIVDAGLKFSNLSPRSFQDFYSHFLELYLIANSYLDPETITPIEVWFRDARNLHETKSMNLAAETATTLALSMKRDLEANGLWTVFSPVGEPPFMMDVIV